jgi:2-keto-4-pentenoate hydratase
MMNGHARGAAIWSAVPLLLALAGPGQAACLDDARVAELVAGYPTTPITGVPPDLTLDDAYCTQAKYVALLEDRMGAPVGYKVGFTGEALQQQFAIDRPATGVLFAPMFVEDGGALPLDFGHRPMIEPDLLVVVKDAGIMDATTALEALEHLASVHAFMELPALQFAEGEKITGTAATAVNIVATRMVEGPPVAVQPTPEFVQALAEMQTVFTDETGAVLQSAPGANLLGNPLNVVLWLVDEMKRRGTPLQAGDRLSLGAPGKLFPLKEGGKTYSYALNGLPGGTTTVSVTIK